MIPIFNDMSIRPVGAISDEDAYSTVEYLNTLLNNEFILFEKTLSFHWNIVGSHFLSVHSYLEKSYQELLEYIDQIAERIRILGESPKLEFKKNKPSMIQPQNGANLNWREIISELLRDHLMIQNSIKYFLKENNLLNDPGTSGTLNSLILMHEMSSWILKSELSYPDQ